MREGIRPTTTSSSTTSTTMFTMLESAPLLVQQSMARRGYNLFCGLAILLSTFGQTSPLAAAQSAKLPFDRLEAGYETGGQSGGFHFVLYRLPGREYNDVFRGSFFCESVCTLPRQTRVFVMLELAKGCGELYGGGLDKSIATQGPKELRGKNDTTTASPTTTSWHQNGKQQPTPTKVSTWRSKDRTQSSTTASTTTSWHQVGKQQSTPTKVVSSSLAYVPPVVTLIQDGDLQDTGPYGGRALSFHYAWDFRQRHDRNRAVEAVKECCPAFMTGFVTGCSRDTFVAAAREQETAGRLYALVCVPKVTQGLLYQLPTATAVRMAIHKEGPGLNLIVNDKTLVRIFESVVWQGPWTNKDPEDLDLCVRTFLHCLCYPRFCDGLQLPQVPSIQANAQQHRAAFEGLLLAVRTQTAASFLASVASSLPGGGDGDPDGATSHRNFPQVRVDPMDMDQHDEAVREVHGSLQPVTGNEKVVEAMERMDDFRKHEETGRFSLHPHLRRELFKVHRNLNHPAKDVFLRALRHSGVREDVLQWVKEFFSCPLCEASKRSLPARPAHLAKALEFNAIVATDLFYMNLFGTEQIFLVCVDYGTGFLQVVRCADARAITVRQNLSKFWIAPFGVPELLICDQGPEFSGEQFVEFMSQMGTAIHFTDGASPWKNGRAERAVGTVKQKIKTVLQETSATAEELDMVLAQVVSAHNSLFDRHGYSPNQRLFGRSLRLPGSLMATDRWDQEMVKAAAGDVIQRTWAIREAARMAWIKEDDVNSVRRTAAAQTRKSDLHSFSFQPGQWAYVWRKNDNRFGWVGPGALIAMAPGGNSWWVNMRGRLWKVSSEQLRPASKKNWELLWSWSSIETSWTKSDRASEPAMRMSPRRTIRQPTRTSSSPSFSMTTYLKYQLLLEPLKNCLILLHPRTTKNHMKLFWTLTPRR